MKAERPATTEERRAWAAFLTNLTVLPGLGTLLHGERLLGLAQIGLATAGFLLICAWLLGFMMEAVAVTGWPEGGGPEVPQGLLGLGLSLAALAWSGWTGYAGWQRARTTNAMKLDRDGS
jgi:hypothetical protein